MKTKFKYIPIKEKRENSSTLIILTCNKENTVLEATRRKRLGVWPSQKKPYHHDLLVPLFFLEGPIGLLMDLLGVLLSALIEKSGNIFTSSVVSFGLPRKRKLFY